MGKYKEYGKKRPIESKTCDECQCFCFVIVPFCLIDNCMIKNPHLKKRLDCKGIKIDEEIDAKKLDK